MATKKTTVKKAAPRASKTTAKAVKPKATGLKRIVREANPEAHVATGKFRFLLCLMVAMVIFAGIAVCAVSVAISAVNQAAEYESCYMEDKNCSLPNKPRDKEAEKNQDNTSYYDSETIVNNAIEFAD